MVTILIVSADPLDTERLRIDQESRDIVAALQQARFGSQFVVETKLAVRLSDLQALLLQYDPTILHFSGHGTATGQIVLEDQAGNAAAVPPDALRRLFSALAGGLRCVVLNSCFSEAQADSIAECVDCVVAMAADVPDTAAIDFAVAFYRALAFGKDAAAAFQLGCAQLALTETAPADTPHLFLRHPGAPCDFVQPEAATAAPQTKSGITQHIVISGDAHTGDLNQIGAISSLDQRRIGAHDGHKR